MKLNKFEYTCSVCSQKFDAVDISDFSYGLFLLWSSAGECRYLNVFEDDTYNEVTVLLKKHGYDEIHLQKVYGGLSCDPDEKGNSFELGSPPCPNCSYRKVKSVASHPKGEQDIQPVSHVKWLSLSESQKETSLLALIK